MGMNAPLNAPSCFGIVRMYEEAKQHNPRIVIDENYLEAAREEPREQDQDEIGRVEIIEVGLDAENQAEPIEVEHHQ